MPRIWSLLLSGFGTVTVRNSDHYRPTDARLPIRRCCRVESRFREWRCDRAEVHDVDFIERFACSCVFCPERGRSASACRVQTRLVSRTPGSPLSTRAAASSSLPPTARSSRELCLSSAAVSGAGRVGEWRRGRIIAAYRATLGAARLNGNEHAPLSTCLRRLENREATGTPRPISGRSRGDATR